MSTYTGINKSTEQSLHARQKKLIEIWVSG